MSKSAMNLRYFTLICLLYLASAAVIPKDVKPTKTASSTSATDKKMVESKPAPTTNKPPATTTLNTAKKPEKSDVKESPKKENKPKPAQIEKPHGVDLQAGPLETDKKQQYGNLETSSSSSGLHFILIVIVIVICVCVAHTYRKKLIGFFIGVRRGTTRRGGNVRYRRLSTGESAIE